MRPLNECQDELIDGKQYTVWLIAPWDDYQLTDGEVYNFYKSSAELHPALSGFSNKNGSLIASFERIVVDI